MIATILLAAGTSSRMRGRDKLMEEIDGTPLLRRMAQVVTSAGLGPLYVALPELPHPRARARIQALEGLPRIAVPVPEASEGMGASLRTAVSALAWPLRGVMVLPADMPDITAADLRLVASAFRGEPLPILRGASGKTPGHPVLFPPDLVPDLRELRGDRGAASVIAAHVARLHLVPLPGAHAVTDLDAPEAWDEWRRSRRL
ncbi:nucleotidyltransferase family protein [Oceanicola sp. S124]|uniref:nucleotidyltransferase family protein n=1 Tax=Oceanicola sp. S124 TaxID=1042378 RepID=UPI0002557924|nr:nucleotidyltransferase family protein [Oceanicola sp. S124]